MVRNFRERMAITNAMMAMQRERKMVTPRKAPGTNGSPKIERKYVKVACVLVVMLVVVFERKDVIF